VGTELVRGCSGYAHVLAVAKNLALFAVYPSFGVVLWGTHLARDVVAPAMGTVRMTSLSAVVT
jgi:hypothetical protein